MIATEAIYADAQGEIVELGDPHTQAFLLVPAGAEIPPHVEEKMKKRKSAKPEVPANDTAKVETRQKRIVTPEATRK